METFCPKKKKKKKREIKVIDERSTSNGKRSVPRIQSELFVSKPTSKSGSYLPYTRYKFSYAPRPRIDQFSCSIGGRKEALPPVPHVSRVGRGGIQNEFTKDLKELVFWMLFAAI